MPSSRVHVAVRRLEHGDVGVVAVETDRAVGHSPLTVSRPTTVSPRSVKTAVVASRSRTAIATFSDLMGMRGRFRVGAMRSGQLPAGSGSARHATIPTRACCCWAARGTSSEARLARPSAFETTCLMVSRAAESQPLTRRYDALLHWGSTASMDSRYPCERGARSGCRAGPVRRWVDSRGGQRGGSVRKVDNRLSESSQSAASTAR